LLFGVSQSFTIPRFVGEFGYTPIFVSGARHLSGARLFRFLNRSGAQAFSDSVRL
jgi:hypothetical protein